MQTTTRTLTGLFGHVGVDEGDDDDPNLLLIEPQATWDAWPENIKDEPAWNSNRSQHWVQQDLLPWKYTLLQIYQKAKKSAK